LPVFHRLIMALAFVAAPNAGLAREVPAEPLSLAACASPDSGISAEGFVPLGGSEQWVTVHGEDCGNPVILFVHGGPGNTMSPYSRAIFGAWESDFTIVQWDQRGAGRTYGRNPEQASSDLSIARMSEDGIELAAHLAAGLGKRRIILVGSSWGSVLGAHMAIRRPDLFHAYVGVSQLVRYRDNQAATYRRLLALARQAEDSATLSRLEALGPPPWTDPRNFGILRRATRVYEGRSAVAGPSSWWVREPPYAHPAVAAEYEAGEEYSYLQFVGRAGDGMLSQVDLPALGTRFGVPVFVAIGSEDLVTDPGVARRWFDMLQAPEKQFILVPRTGHDPNEPLMEAVYNLLRERAARWTIADR
jgi:pimeloyl-ACP methyl ester carboxylesterase